jgi:mono/diheme cytochrome c family protein
MSRVPCRSLHVRLAVASLTVAAVVLAAFPIAHAARPDDNPGPGVSALRNEQVLRGRQLVLTHGCSDCHGGYSNPESSDWLTGSDKPEQVIVIDDLTFMPRNLTPHATTGIGRYTDRQLFNALRWGLRPDATPDIDITSSTPGAGKHPAQPQYLAPFMPWTAVRHMTDQQLHDIIAYLRHGVRPVEHALPENPVPPDGWASAFAPDHIGPVPAAAFPTAYEVLGDPAKREQILHGRVRVIAAGCGDCHGGGSNPAAEGWLAGLRSEAYGRTLSRPPVGPFEIEFPIGPFATRPRNLTPDNTTGLGRFSELQIFNALRYGLRPGETADVEITSATPGQGNHPVNPKYLAPPMPWPAWRHMSDQDLWAIAAYLKHGVRPVRNQVLDSEGPPDFWAGEYVPSKWGTYPATPFPTSREAAQPGR